VNLLNNTINFFWSGNDWSYLHYLTIKSHLKVNHNVIIWLHGKQPNSKYWFTKNITVNNADDIVNITDFIKKGGNFKTASSLWRFIFLYKYGGWYADTDAVALKTWPNDEWVLCSGNRKLISTGILKVPAKESMFNEMINHLELEWGNVHVFNKFNHHSITHDSYNFFPFEWNEWEILFDNKEIPDCYSVHLYHTMFERKGIINNIESIIKQNPNTMIWKLNKWINNL
jgi:hypothetical protein